MPASLVHITFIEELGRDPKIESSLSFSIVQHLEHARLGAVLPDLQYYESFYRLFFRYLLGFSLPFAPWGYLFHSQAPAVLGRAFIEVLRKEPLKEQPEAKLAFIAGYFSHVALDRTLHPLVQNFVAAEGRNDAHARALHGICERYQSLFFHQEVHGVDITGTDICRQKACLLPSGQRKLNRLFYLFLQKACLETFSRSPQKKQFDDWIRGLSLYGWFLGSPLGRYEGLRGDISALRSKYYENQEFSFPEYYGRAKELALHYVNSAYNYWREEELPEEVRRGFLDQITNADLGYPLAKGFWRKVLSPSNR